MMFARPRLPRRSTIAALLLALPLGLFAAEASAMSCSIVTQSGVAFGSYDVFEGAPLDVVGSVTYRCDSVGVSDTVVIHLSRGGAASYFPRKLSQGAYQLDYNLYTTAARTTVWGDGSSGTGSYGPTAPAEGQETTVPIYGRIPAAQNARAGSYADTVITTVIF